MNQSSQLGAQLQVFAFVCNTRSFSMVFPSRLQPCLLSRSVPTHPVRLYWLELRFVFCRLPAQISLIFRSSRAWSYAMFDAFELLISSSSSSSTRDALCRAASVKALLSRLQDQVIRVVKMCNLYWKATTEQSSCCCC